MSDEKSLKEKWQYKIETIQGAIEMCCLSLTEREEEFIDSISIKLEKGKDLSWKQSKWLNDIYNRIE